MSVINPDLIFGNALTYTAEDVISKFNFPSMAKKMANQLNQLVLVRETFSPDGSAYGTLYYTGSIVGFTYEQIVNLEKVEDITLLADEVSQGVNRINELIKKPDSEDSELKKLLEETKQSLKSNPSSGSNATINIGHQFAPVVFTSLDNVSTDINTLNNSLNSFNNILGQYTSEAQQFFDIINKVNQIASSLPNPPLRQGVYNITYQPNPYSISSPNNVLNVLPTIIDNPNNQPTESIVTTIITQQSPITTNISPQSSSPQPRYILNIKIQDGDDPKKIKELEDLEKKYFTELDKLNADYINGKIGTVVNNPSTPQDELKVQYDKDLVTINKNKDDKVKEIEKKYPQSSTPNKPQPSNQPLPNNTECPPGGGEGIKKFQDWLDNKKYKWTTSGKPLNKAKPGYGECGNSTKSAWKTYGNDFLQESLPNNPTQTLTPEEEAIINDFSKAPTLSSSSTFNNVLSTGSLSENENFSDEYIIFLSKKNSNDATTTISSTPINLTTIVFSRNRDQLNQTVNNTGYNAPQDITNLKDFIDSNKIKNLTCINLWSFPKENIATVSLKGRVIASDTGDFLNNAKVKFKPLFSAETRARLEQFINNSGLGSVILQGQQNINDIITSYNNVTGSAQSLITNQTSSL
jgi:hypothetical protein